MNRCIPRTLFLCALLCFLPLCLFAQSGGGKKAVALIPFWGRNQDLAELFGAELFDSVNAMDNYRSLDVNLLNLPEHIPEGGYPPYICPTPVLTRDAPYAITGEIYPNGDDPELWDIMIYLWEVAEARLLCTDKMTIYEIEDCGLVLPGMLEWLFSWVPKDRAPQSVIAAGPAAAQTYWLYLGLRAGGSLNIHADPKDNLGPGAGFIYPATGRYYENFNAALSAAVSMPNVKVLGKFGLQFDGIYNLEIQPFASPASSIFLSPLLKFAHRWESNFFSVLGGVYFVLPLYEVSYVNDKFPMGWSAGVNFGTKAGPGNVFMDIRFSGDIMDTVNIPAAGVYRRNMLTISAGYEFGLITRR